MDKFDLLEKYKKDEKILIGKLFDKIKICEKKNSIQTTDFLTMPELILLQDILDKIQFNNYIVYGGVKEAQRNLIVIYPKKLEKLFKEEKFDYNIICKCIRITNNNEKYEHKVYLGGLIKLGIKREKIGDILVTENGADIIVAEEIAKFICMNINELTRFNKSKVEIINLEDIIEKIQEFEDIIIRVPSMRLDAVVAEIINTSRSKALNIINEERVLVNYKQELKNTRNIQMKDVITIRGKGKYIIESSSGNSRSGRIIVNVKKYI